MKPPLVSVIIPCHNAAPWLAATLESALAQKAAPLEVILVDDASTDGSVAIAETYIPRGLVLLRTRHRNASATRNEGLRASHGDFIQFLDADDLISPDKISSQLELLSSCPPDSLASCRWGRFTQDPSSARFVDTAVYRDFTPADFLILCAHGGHMMHPSAWLCPRGLLERSGPWNEQLSLNDDGEFFARVVRASSGIRFSGEGLSYYRSGVPGSLSARRDEAGRRSQFLSVELIGHQLLAAENSPRSQAALADLYQRFIHDFYPFPPDLMKLAEARVRLLGGSDLKPAFGPRATLLARLCGWKNFLRLRFLLQRKSRSPRS